MVNISRNLKQAASALFEGAGDFIPKQNLKDLSDKWDASYKRAFDLLDPAMKQDFFKRVGQANVLKSRYTQNLRPHSIQWGRLKEDQKLAILETIRDEGLLSDKTKTVMDSWMGEGAHNIFKNISFEAYRDPMFGSKMSLNERYIPGVKETITRLKKGTTKEGRVSNKVVARSMADPAKSKQLLKKLAEDPRYNLFEAQYSKLNRNLNRFTVIGYAPVKGTYQQHPLDPARIMPAPKRDELGNPVLLKDAEGELLLDSQGKPILDMIEPEFKARTREDAYGPYESSVGDALEQYVQANYKMDDPLAQRLTQFRKRMEGEPLHRDFMDDLTNSFIYASLTNNLGTAAGNALDTLKSTVSNKAMVEGMDLLVKDKELRDTLMDSTSILSHKRTELGDTIQGAEIPVLGVEIPDVTDRIQTFTKSHLWVSAMLDALNKKNVSPAVKEDFLRFLKTKDMKQADELYRKNLEAGVDFFDSVAYAMEESDRVAGRIIPQNQRGMFAENSGGLRLAKISESALNYLDQQFKAFVGSIKGDKEAQAKLGGIFRATAVKGGLFGLGGVVSSDVMEFIQENLPEDKREEFYKFRASAEKAGLISGPSAALGVNTDRLVQPTIQGMPVQLFGGIPIFSDISNILGDGNARSKQGKIQQGAGSAVKLAAAGSRLLMPTAPITGILNALNPSATGRVAYEGLRTVGVAPDSVAPGEYKLGRKDTRKQTPTNYINAVLGTTPDWKDKQWKRLVKELKDE